MVDKTVQIQITETKKKLKQDQGFIDRVFLEVRDDLRREMEIIRNCVEKGERIVPEVAYEDIENGMVSEQVRSDIRRRGCAVIRGVFDRTQVDNWNAALGSYIDSNHYFQKQEKKRGLDNYFSGLASGKPQIFGLYWSKPQIEARQARSMASTKRFLNRLWDVSTSNGNEFNPDFDYAYADRTRRREPGDVSLGLSPHMDSGSYERWTDAAYQKIYGSVFAGRWQDYDPWKAEHRTETREYPSPAVCSMFRTFQGWTALTPQGPNDGTLGLVPYTKGIIYMLLRALQDDVAADDLCGAEPGRALSAHPEWHPDLLAGLVSIPHVEPGDTVWWHPDIIHAVEDEHKGSGYSNVIYIGASPECEKNRAYARKQAERFLAGKSAPDFAAEDYEVDFTDRATIDDLTELGRRQMALD